MEATPNSTKTRLITRTFPDAAFEPLRWQVGRVEHRPAVEPPLRLRKDLADPRQETVECFHLLGFGQTEPEAQAMARRALARCRA